MLLLSNKNGLLGLNPDKSLSISLGFGSTVGSTDPTASMSGLWQAKAPQRFLQHFLEPWQSLSIVQVGEQTQRPVGTAGHDPGFSRWIKHDE